MSTLLHNFTELMNFKLYLRFRSWYFQTFWNYMHSAHDEMLLSHCNCFWSNHDRFFCVVKRKKNDVCFLQLFVQFDWVLRVSYARALIKLSLDVRIFNGMNCFLIIEFAESKSIRWSMKRLPVPLKKRSNINDVLN